MNHDDFIVRPGSKIRLKDFDPDFRGPYEDKDQASEKLQKDIERLAKYQEVLYAQNTWALLVVLQAMDTAGKDGTIRHVMSGVNPQGTQVHSFKAPSDEELDHDFLWRSAKAVPERGNIGIFNRSYYEEVLVVRVHPQLLDSQKLPKELTGKGIWKHRFEQINHFEEYLVQNGIAVLKFFLNISREEQKRRLLARIDTPDKNWKFSAADVQERRYWDDYQQAFSEMLSKTSTEWAPWYVIPADHKWFRNLAVSQILVREMEQLPLRFPKPKYDPEKICVR